MENLNIFSMTHIYYLSALMLLAASGYAQTRYLSATGTNAGDCTLPGSPCAHITYAVGQAQEGDTVLLDGGNYTFSVTQIVDKSVVVTARDLANRPRIVSGASDVLEVNAGHVIIRGLRLEMGLTATTGLRGLVLHTENDSITVIDNEILSTKLLGSGMVFNAYGIVAYGGDSSTLFLHGNEVRPQSILNDAFGRGIGLGLTGLGNAPGGEVYDNSLQAFYPLEAVRNTSDLKVWGNDLSGTTLINMPANDAVINLTDNLFTGVNDLVAGNLYALLVLRGVDSAHVYVEGNEFANYVNFGLFSSASHNVHISGNEFGPSATASGFTSIHVNSKLMTTGAQNGTYPNGIEIKGNTFHAGAANGGTAIAFADHFGANSPAFEDSVKVGGPGQAEKNIFEDGLRYFIALDSSSGNSSVLPLWQDYSVSVMRPFSQDVHAYVTWNNYPTAVMEELEAGAFDRADHPGLGDVLFMNPASVTENAWVTVSTFPNPATDVLYFRAKDLSGNLQVRVTDMQGRTLLVENRALVDEPAMLDVQTLPAGLYTLCVEKDGKRYDSRFVKQ